MPLTQKAIMGYVSTLLSWYTFISSHYAETGSVRHHIIITINVHYKAMMHVSSKVTVSYKSPCFMLDHSKAKRDVQFFCSISDDLGNNLVLPALSSPIYRIVR